MRLFNGNACAIINKDVNLKSDFHEIFGKMYVLLNTSI